MSWYKHYKLNPGNIEVQLEELRGLKLTETSGSMLENEGVKGEYLVKGIDVARSTAFQNPENLGRNIYNR